MKISLSIIFSFIVALSYAQQPAPAPGAAPQGPPPGPPTYSIRLSSTSFEDGAVIPAKHLGGGPPPTPPTGGAAPTTPPTGGGAPTTPPTGGASPQFSWTGFPAATQTFVLYMHDLDVTRNKSIEDATHWVVWNIPATTTSLAENLPNAATLPDGSQQYSMRGPVYAGPGAPAAGPYHHYIFELLAVDIKLDITPGANTAETRDKIFEAVKGHVLAKGIYVGRAKRLQ